MATAGWVERFLASTRGRILTLLRRAGRTVNELAAAVGLTDNAVRAHLTALERDGLVQPEGLRPGTRKPNVVYRLTGDAEPFFPKPYGPVLQQCLAVLAERLDPAALEDVLRTVGRRVAVHYRPAVQAAEARERVHQAVAVLGELGGLAEVEDAPGGLLIRGFDCPLAAAVAGHPCACRLAETLLTELIGRPVEECCEKQGPPRCAFRVRLTE